MFKKIVAGLNIFQGNFFKKPLYIHLIWAVFLIVVLIQIASLWLNIYTRRNSYSRVPYVLNKKSDKAIELLEDANLDYSISDSIYLDNFAPNTIVKQIPDSGNIVKKHRTVYLIINRQRPPSVEIPNLEGVNYNTAYEILKNKGLTVLDTIYRDDLGADVVIDILINNRSVQVGEKLPVGINLTLVLGNGKKPNLEYEWVPNLVGLSIEKAALILLKLKLKISVQTTLTQQEQEGMIIQKQQPEEINIDGDKNKLLQGSTINVQLNK